MQSTPRPDSACPGCHLVLPAHNGPAHAYLGASPACWSLYQRIASPPYLRKEGTRSHRLVLDAYAAQHPGVQQRRSVQSVAVHLMGLCRLLERAAEQKPPRRAPRATTVALHWLAPPAPIGRLTVADVIDAGPDDGHEASVEAWARDVWRAWSAHHRTVQGWLDTPADGGGRQSGDEPSSCVSGRT